MNKEELIETIVEMVIKKLKVDYYLTPRRFKQNIELESFLLERLLHYVCETQAVDISSVRGGNQVQDFVHARFLFFYIARHIFKKEIKLQTIGSFVGKDHSSAKYGIK